MRRSTLREESGKVCEEKSYIRCVVNKEFEKNCVKVCVLI